MNNVEIRNKKCYSNLYVSTGFILLTPLIAISLALFIGGVTSSEIIFAVILTLITMMIFTFALLLLLLKEPNKIIISDNKITLHYLIPKGRHTTFGPENVLGFKSKESFGKNTMLITLDSTVILWQSVSKEIYNPINDWIKKNNIQNEPLVGRMI